MAKDINRIVRENLRGLLDKHHMTQSSLAKRIGISQTSMSNYMFNRPFSIDTLSAIVNVFGVTMNDVLTEDKYLSDSERERVLGYVMHDEGAKNLCNAIAAQAARDFIQALMDGDKAEAKNCMHFFESDWGRTVTGRRYTSALRGIPEKVEEFKAKNKIAMARGEETFYKDSESEGTFKCPVCGGEVFTHRRKNTRKNRNGGTNLYWSGKCNKCCSEHKILIGEV